MAMSVFAAMVVCMGVIILVAVRMTLMLVIVTGFRGMRMCMFMAVRTIMPMVVVIGPVLVAVMLAIAGTARIVFVFVFALLRHCDSLTFWYAAKLSHKRRLLQGRTFGS
jgi:hypothetical protein